eukprot:scaffold420042_cov37-Prasinocladus_malaysianus.AAC.1
MKVLNTENFSTRLNKPNIRGAIAVRYIYGDNAELMKRFNNMGAKSQWSPPTGSIEPPDNLQGRPNQPLFT